MKGVITRMCYNATVDQIIEVFRELKDTAPRVYMGIGLFNNLEIRTEPMDLEMSINWVSIPKDYKKFLSAFGEICIGENDATFFSYESAIATTNAYDDAFPEGFLCFATCLSDTLLIDCNTQDGQVYWSSEGIEDARPLQMSFVEFLDALCVCSFVPFWHWKK